MKSAHTILCKACGTEVARTPNGVCIKCNAQNWGYTKVPQPVPSGSPQLPANSPIVAAPLPEINPPAISKLVCKNCNTMVAKTPNERCINCGRLLWGYTRAQVEAGQVMLTMPKQKHYGLVIALSACLLIITVLAIYYFGQPRPVTDMAKAVARVETQFTANGVTYKVKGTAFLISPTKLLTAAHVAINPATGEKLQSLDVIFTKLGNKHITAKVLAVGDAFREGDKRSFFLYDFAVLEIPPLPDVKPLALGNSDEVQELSDVITIGHSLGDNNLSMTEGKINSLVYQNEDGRSLDLFKHSITTNHGNSGGPVIFRSKVIGILVGLRNEPDGPVEGEKIANKINNIRKQLLSMGIDLDN